MIVISLQVYENQESRRPNLHADKDVVSASTASKAKPRKCQHGRMRSQCKECGGGSICQHGRMRSQCKECGGGAAFASMDECAIDARSAEGAAFVSTDEDAISATEGVWRKLHMSTWTNAQSMQA